MGNLNRAVAPEVKKIMLISGLYGLASDMMKSMKNVLIGPQTNSARAGNFKDVSFEYNTFHSSYHRGNRSIAEIFARKKRRQNRTKLILRRGYA